jgi:short-subunit dehydrogenase
MKLRLKPVRDQVMVITGATSGIGLSTARLAHRRGARLVLAARSERALTQLGAELGGPAGRAIAVPADVSREQDVERLAAAARGTFGGFDTWINNAAVSAYGKCLDVTLEDMRRIMDTNFWGVVYGSRAACAHLRESGGALINVGSVVSDRAVPLQGPYSASKHAIKAWTDALRVELAYERVPISVTLIKPSAIDTPYALNANNYLDDQPSHTPPVYTPESVAKAILYAAEHPVRDVVVGSAGKVLSLASVLAPRLTDALMTTVILPGTHSGRRREGHPALYQPSEHLRVRGDYQGIVRGSIYTALGTRRTLVQSLAVGAALTTGALLLASKAGR